MRYCITHTSSQIHCYLQRTRMHSTVYLRNNANASVRNAFNVTALGTTLDPALDTTLDTTLDTELRQSVKCKYANHIEGIYGLSFIFDC